MQTDNAPLFHLDLLKTAKDEDKPWKFAGIASDEGSDVEGDEILKKALDVSYAAERGFVNWNHSRDPEDQIGFLTRCDVITAAGREKIEETLGIQLRKSASVYVEGELYKHVDRAKSVFNIMKSTPDGAPGLGLSLDGAMRKSADGKVLKAFVRGVAMAPAPAHPRTLSRLMKCLDAGDSSDYPVSPEPFDITVARTLGQALAVKEQVTGGMSFDDAVLWTLRQKPDWTYALASQFVTYVTQNS